MENLRIIYKLPVYINNSSPDLLMISRGQGRPFFSGATRVAIAALKFSTKRSHTCMYVRAIVENFALLSQLWWRQKSSHRGVSETIAALKISANRSHACMYARAIVGFFALLSPHWKRQKIS